MANSIRNVWNQYRSVPLVYRIGAAFVLGSAVGLLVGQPATLLQPLGDLFVELLNMIIVPIVIFTLFMGIRQLSPASLGKIGGQVVVLYVITSGIAVAIGLVVANLINPGTALSLPETNVESEEAPSFIDILFRIVPENPFNAIVNGDLLAILFFVIVFGIAIVIVRDTSDNEQIRASAESFLDVMEMAAEAMFKVVWGVLEYGVIGVFAIMAATMARVGIEALVAFAVLTFTLALALTIHIVIIYLGILIRALSGQSPSAFLVGSKDAMITALSIRSSSGTLPVTMSDADENLQIEESIYGFSLPLGATINMDGTAMYIGIATIFAANIVGVSLSIVEQVIVVLIAVFASIGAAGVPGAGLIMLSLVLSQLGLPLEVVALVAAIDPILDRMRTMTNITGDLAVSTLVGKWNGATDFTGGVWEEYSPNRIVSTSSDD